MHRSVEELWQANKNSCWDVTDHNGNALGTITLEEAFLGQWDTDDTPEEAMRSLDAHQETISYWSEQYLTYWGRESEIPEEWSLELDGDEVRDGNHRLVAAKLTGLISLPVR